MKIICSWCSKDMGEKSPFEDKQISHAMCEICAATMQTEVDQYFSRSESEKGERKCQMPLNSTGRRL